MTICRAFHWLDQPTVLRTLEGQVTEDGVVAIFGDNGFWAARSEWMVAAREVVQLFLGQQRRVGAGTFAHHNRPFCNVLRESAFNHVNEARVPVRRVWTFDSIIGYLYSTTFAAPHLFGERRKEFETTLAERLAGFSDDDTYVEHNEFLILIGRRTPR